MPGKKKKEELTPEEYRQKARKEIQDLKNQWKIFFKTGFVMLAALIAIIVASIAWFVSNNKVDFTGVNIRAAGSEFDLAASGSTNGVYDQLLSVLNGEKNIIYNKEYSVTSGNRTAISWAITDDSNLRNEKDESLGIEPGSSGSITFYIIPHKNGALNVSLTLSLTGYTLEDTETEELKPESLKEIKEDTQQLLEGHILLFAGYDGGKNSYKGWISQDGASWSMRLDGKSSLSQKENGELIWSIKDATAENAYPVTVYWIWPELLESYLLKKESYTGTRPLLFPEEKDESTSDRNPEALPSNLFEKMCKVPDGSSDTPVNSNRYFRWESKETFENTVKGGTTLYQIRNRYNSALYGNVAAYYDLADQYIGSNVQNVKLTLNAK
ncbi:hypothetical protein [uncultured Eubacterium sp.]|uniref:hypothetical protein n=1 Tax=uncultured Eubacterium sp. TaxID=165185 RepID=UPI00259A7409|nr:hypothetical protein [uncultured Eubacterium sp.]